MHKNRSLFKFPITRTETNEEQETEIDDVRCSVQYKSTYTMQSMQHKAKGEGGRALQCRAASATLTSVNFYIAPLRPKGLRFAHRRTLKQHSAPAALHSLVKTVSYDRTEYRTRGSIRCTM